MSKNPVTTSSGSIKVAVTPNLKSAFASLTIKGQGGFQTLMRDVSEKVVKSSGIVKFTPDEFTRVTRYATSYGEGGFQQRLRLLVSQWVAQNITQLTRG